MTVSFFCAYMGQPSECRECGGFNRTGTQFCSTECEANLADRVAEQDAVRQKRRDQEDAFAAEVERLRTLGATDYEIDLLTKDMP